MNALIQCPICGFNKFNQYPRDGDMYFFRCERCGEFETSWEFLNHFGDIDKRMSEIGYILSGLARELYETKDTRPKFLYGNIEETMKSYLIPDITRIEEKIQKLLQRLREKTEFFGQAIKLGDIETVVPLAYAKNSDELIALFNLMTEKKLAEINITKNEKDDGLQRAKVILSANGWDITNSFQKKNREFDKGFVAVWFDDSMNESIGAIEGAITECGFKSVCIRDEHFSEKIMDKALGEIRQSRFVIVDLTGARSSVFFEAGFAHGLGIDSIYVYKDDGMKKESPLEFYVKHYQCYKYKDSSDLKETLRNAIKARIKIKNPGVVS